MGEPPARPVTRRVTWLSDDAPHQIRIDVLLNADDEAGDCTAVGCTCGAVTVLPGDATLDACWAAWRTPHASIKP